MNIPNLPSRLNKETKRKDINGNKMHYSVIDEDVFVAPSNSEKAFALHKLKFSDGREEYRIGYYMIAKKPRVRGKWAWGQFAPMMTKEEMKIIFEHLKKWL
jgi:hypothetical protein